jgi:fermentation-respiration switch protein FrsA (DUF1100 family)
VRRQADTPWFRSLLIFDPIAKIVKVKQSILILQGALDTQVPPHHADRLARAAAERKKKPLVEQATLPGVNHLLIRAQTGTVAEYAKLTDKTVVPEAIEKIAGFLAR